MYWRQDQGQVKEESNYWLIPGQWANELHNAVGVQGKLFLTLLLTTFNVNVSLSECVIFSHTDLACKGICIQHKPACHEV